MMTDTNSHADRPFKAVASFDSYARAEAFVDRLADDDYPVERLSIVGRDLELVERVTGRLTIGTALASGAAFGAVIGLLFGWFFGVLFAPDGLSLLATIVYWVLISAFVGLGFGAISYALSGGHSYRSVSGVQAARYDVVADADAADDILRRMAADQGPGQDRSSVWN